MLSKNEKHVYVSERRSCAPTCCDKNKENNEKEPLGKNSNIATIYFNNL